MPPDLLAPCPSPGRGGACPASVSSRVSPVFLHSSPACEKPVFSLMRVLGTEMLVWETEWRTTGGLTPVTLFPATATSRGTSTSRREAHSTSPGTWTWSRFCDPARWGRGPEGWGPTGHPGQRGPQGEPVPGPMPSVVTPPPAGRACPPEPSLRPLPRCPALHSGLRWAGGLGSGPRSGLCAPGEALPSPRAPERLHRCPRLGARR